MKALFLTNEYPPHVYGGAGVHVEYLTRELARGGLAEVEVRCFGDQDTSEPGLRVAGTAVPPGLLRAAPEKLRSPLGTLARCVDFAARPSGADVVHCHTWYSHFGGVLCKQLYGIPLVITTHSLEPLRPWKREQLGRGYDFSSWVERTALTMADAVIAVSQETRRDVLEHFAVSPERVTVIPNGIDIDEYRFDADDDQLERYGVPRDLRYLLFVGRITRQKGIIHLLRAIPHLDPDLGVVLCAGAPDTEEIAEEMQATVAELQRHRQHVYWIEEMVPKRAAIQLYSHAAVFCCPSIYEPFGIINLEAMACGTPVVASAVGGIKEVVVDGETGALVQLEQQQQAPFEPVDPDGFARAMADAVSRVLADEERRRRYGAAGRERVEQRFSWSAVARQVQQLYLELARSNDG